MEHQTFLRSQSLNNISDKKLQMILNHVDQKENLQNKEILKSAYLRYYESNIPVEYWNKTMEKDFIGDKNLLKEYNNYTNDLKHSFITGDSFLLAGAHGVGKSLTLSNILKKTSLKGYNCLYTTLSDVVHVLTKAPPQEVYLARKELIQLDFLCIDEFDNRFMATENAADLFARTLESIFRTRSQNKMPTLMCTNSPNILNAFNGPLKESIDSLLNGYMRQIIVFGDDFRKNQK